MSMQNTNKNEENIDIKKYIFLFLQYWRTFVVSLVIAFSISFLYTRYTAPIYEAQNSVYISEKEDAMGAMSSIMKEFGSIGGKGQNIDNQIGILSSYSLVRSTLESLNYNISYFNRGRINNVEIYNLCPFRVEIDTITFSRKRLTLSDSPLPYDIYKEKLFISIISPNKVKIAVDRDSNSISEVLHFGETFTNKDYSFKIVKSEIFDSTAHINQDYFVRIYDYNSLTKKYMSNLSVEASYKKGSIMQLSCKGEVPEKISEFLNTLIIKAINKDLDEKNSTSSKTIEFIDHQLSGIIDSLSYAEKNLELFRSSNKIVNLSEEGSVMFKKMEELQAKKSIIEVKTKYYEYLLKTIREKSSFKDIITPSVIGVQDQLLNSLVGQLSQLYSERQVLEYTATGDNPSLQIVNMKIRNTITALGDNVYNLIESSQIEMTEVNKEIAKVDANIKKLPSTERELLNIQRKFNLNDNIYNFLLQKRAEVGITKAANIPDLKFIDYALVENTVLKSPKKMFNYAIAIFIGLFIPGLIIIVLDYTNETIGTREEIENGTTIPILGSITKNRRTNETFVVSKYPKSSITESFRTIRTNLPFFIDNAEVKGNIITFTSSISGEGKSFCALNLGAIIAMNNKKVVVIGLDLRKPKLHEMLQDNTPYGVVNYLIKTHTIDELIRKTEQKNLDVILSGPTPPNPLELIESKRFDDFIQALIGKGYDYIIIDTPPIGLVADTLTISKFSDLNIFVMRQNYTNKRSLKFVNDLATENKINNLCILINDVNIINSYGYRYGSIKNYRYGYGYYEEQTYEDNSFTGKLKRILKKQ